MISFLSVFPPYRGGISKFSDYLYRSMQPLAPLKAFNYHRLYPGILFPGRTQYITDFNADENYAEPLLHAYNPFSWKESALEMAEFDSDHLLISYWHPFFAPALCRICSLLKWKQPDIRITILAHNVVPHDFFPMGQTLSRSLMNRADQIILLSRYSRGQAVMMNIRADIHTLFHPVYEQPLPDTPKKKLRERMGFTGRDTVFLFFGLIRPYKGLELFIEALNQLDLKKLNIKPLIAGEFYVDKQELLERIKPEHKSSYTIIDEFVSDRKMAELFTLSDALVMPYRSATQSGILANAINFSLPPIVTDLPGLTEHLEHEQTAWIIEPENSAALKSALLRFTQDDVIRQLAQNLKGLKKGLSWEQFTAQLLPHLQKENQ